MVFGKLSSQLTGNKSVRSKASPQSGSPTNSTPPPPQRRPSVSTSVTSSAPSGISAPRSQDPSRGSSRSPGSSPPPQPAATAALSSNQTSAARSAAATTSSSVEPIARAASMEKSAASAPASSSLGAGMSGGRSAVAPGRGRGVNSCVRRDRVDEPNDAEADNPLIDDLLAELGTPSEHGIGVPAKLKKMAASRPGGKSATASPSTMNRKEVEASSGSSATAKNVVDSNAPRGLNVTELTRGSSFDGFDAQGFQRRRSSDVPASTMSRGVQGGKEAFDTIATASQHFVHVLRMHDMDGYFGAAESAKEDEVKKALGKKTPQEVQNLVVSLMDILEEVRLSRGRIGAMRGSFSHLDMGEKRAMSASMLSTMSTASLARPPVHETTRVAMAYDGHGNRMINRYTVLADLGQGAYGKVKLGREGESGNQVAIKIIDKKHLKRKLGGPSSSSDGALKREIAIMKKVRHRNCVSLYEVIDDPGSNKLYLIMDYVPNGPVVRLKHQNLMPFLLRAAESRRVVNGVMYNVRAVRFCARNRVTDIDVPLSEEEINSQPSCFCCRPLRQSICALYLRQLVSGLRYMHKRNVVHHDIKPDNILLGVDHHVFLTDFGVSEILQKTSEPAATTDLSVMDDGSQSDSNVEVRAGRGGGGGGPRLGGGTLLFTAPELLDPDVDQSTLDPFATDVWALGVTLYCMLFGFAPFAGKMYGEVVHNVREAPFFWSDSNLVGAPLMPEWKEVLAGMLEKKPTRRWTLVKLKEYLDSPGFHLALQAADMEGSSVMENELGVSLALDRHTTSPSSVAGRASAGRLVTTGAGGPSSRPVSSGALSPSYGAGNGFPSITRVSSISTSQLYSFPSSLHPTPASTHVLSPSALPAVDRAAGSTNVNQNKYLPWDMGVSEQDVRDACLTVQVDMVESRPHEISPHTKACVHAYVQNIRDRVRPQQRLFSATPRLKRTSSQMRADLEAEFGSGRENNEDDVLTDSEDDPLGAQPLLGGRWPRVRPFAPKDSTSDPEASSRSSEVPLVPVAGTFHRVTDQGPGSKSTSKSGSPKTSPSRACSGGQGPSQGVATSPTATATDGTSQLPTYGISVNPNANTRPMGRRKVATKASDVLMCGSQSLDAMLSIVELQSEGPSTPSSYTEHNDDDEEDDDDDDEEAMGPRAFTRTRLPSHGDGVPRERKFLSISHATPDTGSLDQSCTNGDSERFNGVRKPSVTELRKAVGQTPSSSVTSQLFAQQQQQQRSPPPTASSGAPVTNSSTASTTANGSLTPSLAAGSSTTGTATSAANFSPRGSLSGNARPSTRKPVTVQKLASASAPGNLPTTHPRSSTTVVDTKRAMLNDNDTQVQRQLSTGKDRRARTRDSSLTEIATPIGVDGQSTSSASGGTPVLTAWERKSRR